MNNPRTCEELGEWLIAKGYKLDIHWTAAEDGENHLTWVLYHLDTDKAVSHFGDFANNETQARTEAVDFLRKNNE